MIRVILGMLAVAALLFAAYYVYSPRSDTIAFQWYGFNGIAVEQYPIRLGEGFNPDVKDVTPDGKYVKVGHYGVQPVMLASPWLPDGTPIEYTYTRVTALFNATDVDPKRDVKWFVYTIHFKSIWEELPVGVMYGMKLAVKEGYGPVLDFNCLQLVKTRSSVVVYNATCPGNTAAVYSLSAYYLNGYNGKRMFCVYVYYFKQDVWYRARGWGFGSMYDYFCKPWDKPPRNITATVSPWGLAQSRVDTYVDGTPVYTLWVRSNYARFYTGPYDLNILGLTTPRAFVMLNYPGIIFKPLGSVLLLMGNDTVMTPPRYVIKAIGWGQTQARVELTHDQGVAVLPGRTYDNSTVYTWPTVPVRIHGRPAELPYRALVNVTKLCPGGAVVSGRYSWVGGWVKVRGPASIHCAEYPVTFTTPAGNATVIAGFNTTLTWQPPPIVYPNGTRLEADPVSIYVDGPKTVRVNYTRVYYLVRVAGFNGTWELWAPRGGELELPVAVALDNGTRLVIREAVANGRPAAAKIKVEEPLNITLRYRRQYLVKLEAPVNSTVVWADEGSVFKVGLADAWEPGNGTLFKKLLVNGTAQREFRVDKPTTLRAEYAETHYWIEVVTPVNATRGWMPKGAVLKFPDAVDFGNGTQLIKPSVREVVVEGPVVLKVEYAKRQHYVKIEGVNKWEGWVDAGAVVRLNSTVVGGVEYTPAEVVTATGPGVYRPLFYAVYRAVARDALGVPNPLATVRLCGATASPLPDGSAVVAAYTRELCQPAVEAFPISPYTAAGAAALAAALALRKRKK
ncbi:MAG: thermopsin-like protease [Pyrobaculum sp.]|jgi:hypothetical protein